MNKILFLSFFFMVFLSSCSKEHTISDLNDLELENQELFKATQFLMKHNDLPLNIIYCEQGFDVVNINGSVWMVNNLNTEVYANGDTIPEVKGMKEWYNLESGAWSHYDNSDSMGALYGKLYNFWAVKDERCLCPKGWHVGTYEEWMGLIDFYGGRFSAPYFLIKENTKQTYELGNQSGFSALMGGYRPTEDTSEKDKVDFDGLSGGVWWTATETPKILGIFKLNESHGMDLCPDFAFKSKNAWYVGKSVRCVLN